MDFSVKPSLSRVPRALSKNETYQQTYITYIRVKLYIYWSKTTTEERGRTQMSQMRHSLDLSWMFMHFIRFWIHLSPQCSWSKSKPNKKPLNVYSSSNRNEFIDVPQQNYIYIHISISIPISIPIYVCTGFSWISLKIISRLRQKRVEFSMH